MVSPSMSVHVSNVAPQLGKLGAAVGNRDGLALARVGAFVGTKVGAAVGNRDGLAVARVGAYVGTRVDIDVRALAGMATRENEAGITTMA